MFEESIRNSTNLNSRQIAAHLSIFTGISVLISAQYIIYLVASWGNRRILPQLLSSWRELEKNLTVYTRRAEVGNDSNSKRFTRTFRTVVITTLAAAMTTIFLVVTPMRRHEDFYIEAFICGFVWLCMAFTEVLHDWAVILSLKELASNFHEVQEDVRRWDEMRSRINGSVVDNWYELVVAIRGQGNLVSKYLSGTQLPSLLQTIPLGTLCLFSALLVLSGTEAAWGEIGDDGVLTGNLICTAFLLLRLNYKVSLGQKITNEVGCFTGLSMFSLSGFQFEVFIFWPKP